MFTGENEIISRVLEKMSKDYDDLKRVIESQKCSKDDKIMALRKTARALETENELLQEEKMMIEKERLRVHQNFLSQIRQLEMTISRQQQQLDDGNTEKRTLVVKVQQLDTEKQKLTATVANMDREIAACKSQLSKVKLGEDMNTLILISPPPCNNQKYFFLFSYFEKTKSFKNLC